MDEMAQRDRRQYYRLVYPASHRPTFRNDIFVYEVYDVSAFGIRFICSGFQYHMHQEVSGTITFHDGRSYNVEGKVIRITRQYVIIKLSKGIPERKIIDEQRQLIPVLRKRKEDEEKERAKRALPYEFTHVERG